MYIHTEYVDNTFKLKHWLKIRHNPQKLLEIVENTSAHYTRQTKKRYYDVRLSRQEGSTRDHLGNAHYWDRPAGGDTERLSDV